MFQETNILPLNQLHSFRHGFCDRPVGDGAFLISENMEKPRLIEDLGRSYQTEKSKEKTRFGIFECPYCSKAFRASTYSVNNNNTKSCGCLQVKRVTERNYRHGGSKSVIYHKWINYKRRCSDINDEYYGGRGISVCEEWRNSFVAFRDWSHSHGYKAVLEIDRIDNDGPWILLKPRTSRPILQ